MKFSHSSALKYTKELIQEKNLTNVLNVKKTFETTHEITYKNKTQKRTHAGEKP